MIAKNNKAHDEVGLTCAEYIADFDNATPEQRQQDDSIKQLDSLQSDLGLPTNHSDNVRYLYDDISIKDGHTIGTRQPNTKDTLGLVILNSEAKTVNIASHTPNSDKNAILSNLEAGAFVIGTMNRDSDWWLVSSLVEGVMLYAALASNDPNMTVLVCLNADLFDKTLRH